MCFKSTGLMAASLTEGANSPVDKDLFIIWVATGTMAVRHPFIRDVGMGSKELVEEFIFKTMLGNLSKVIKG